MPFGNFLLKKTDRATPSPLEPLTPEYNQENHGSYVEQISLALKDTKVRNIALSGNYGVGKSSILQEVVNQHKKRIVEISLSTLVPKHEAPIVNEGSEATTPKQETITNRIQQEIVKQLLYSIKPHQSPHSRFQRIERFNWWRESLLALITGMVIVIGFVLTGWTDKLAKTVLPIIDLSLWAHPVVFGLGGLLILGTRSLVHGRIHISKLSAGAATVTLDAKSTSYFDQYLDEIVYFFEVSPKTIVVFEDIDRFDDAHIFETLRALNTLLNAAPQIKKPIRFIYAIKDSIFDPKQLNTQDNKPEEVVNPEDAEIIRANRTKFFDLVIPVVPFITHRSARNLVRQILKNIDHTIDNELIDLAARYVPDMRLLKNVRNEFSVFREKLRPTEKNTLNLNDSELFAMMLYKSTHMADFELIRLGKSKLDKLYQISRTLVADNISPIERNIRQNQSNQIKFSKINLNKRSEELGEQLIEHIKRTVRAAGDQLKEGTLTFNSATIPIEHLKKMDFWRTFISSDEQNLQYDFLWHDYDYRRQRNMNLTFKYSDLPTAFADVSYWVEMEKKDFEASVHKQKNQLKTLRSAHMAELTKQPDFLVKYNNSSQSFETIARDILSNGLAYQLLRSGYITDNFTLYTSIFHGDIVSPAATNFLIHNVKRNIMDAHLVLTDTDIASIIKESGVSTLSDPCLYNLSILNYLLKHDPAKADIMVQSLIQFGEDEKRFLQAYLNGKNEHLTLIKKFALKTEEILKFLINTIELDDEMRLTLVNTALENLHAEREYYLNDSVTNYLSTHYAKLPVLLSSTEESQAENIAKLYANAVIRVPKLQPLSESIRKAFIAKSLYKINLDNLQVAIGSDTHLALDTAFEKDNRIYDYLLLYRRKYLLAIINTSYHTVSSNEYFIKVIEDVLTSNNSDNLDNIVMNASAHCIIDTLDDVQTDAWQCLAKNNRFTPTLNNIRRYIEVVGSIDKSLEKVLIENEAITEHESAPEGEKETLAIEILNANENNLTAKHRVQLVESLELTDHCLDALDLPVETGALFPLLLNSKLIKDCVVTYERLLETDWSTRESYIEIAPQFEEYVTPELLQGDLKAFLASPKIDLKIKKAVVERAEEFTRPFISDKNDLIALAKFAIKQNHPLPIDVIEKMANKEVETQDIILLLAPHLETIDKPQLCLILEKLKDDYPKLTDIGEEKPKVPDSVENRKLLDTLKGYGIVRSYTRNNGLLNIQKNPS